MKEYNFPDIELISTNDDLAGLLYHSLEKVASSFFDFISSGSCPDYLSDVFNALLDSSPSFEDFDVFNADFVEKFSEYFDWINFVSNPNVSKEAFMTSVKQYLADIHFSYTDYYLSLGPVIAISDRSRFYYSVGLLK